jgi:hypothetical protein
MHGEIRNYYVWEETTWKIYVFMGSGQNPVTNTSQLVPGTPVYTKIENLFAS